MPLKVSTTTTYVSIDGGAHFCACFSSWVVPVQVEGEPPIKLTLEDLKTKFPQVRTLQLQITS